MPLSVHGNWGRQDGRIHEIAVFGVVCVERWLDHTLREIVLLAHEISRTFRQVIKFAILFWNCMTNWLYVVIHHIRLLELVLGLQKAFFNLVRLIWDTCLNIWAYHFDIFLILVLGLKICGTLCANLVHLILQYILRLFLKILIKLLFFNQ